MNSLQSPLCSKFCQYKKYCKRKFVFCCASNKKILTMEDPVQYFWILSTVILSSWLAICLLRRYTSPNSSSSSSSARVHALRLFPGDEIKTSLLNYCRQNSIEAAYIITCVGSLSKIHLRYAYSSGHFDKESWSRGQVIDGQFEILSMVGTIDGRGESTL